MLWALFEALHVEEMEFIFHCSNSKARQAYKPKHFRPISLCNDIYRIQNSDEDSS